MLHLDFALARFAESVCDPPRFGEFIEPRGTVTAAWRGDVPRHNPSWRP